MKFKTSDRGKGRLGKAALTLFIVVALMATSITVACAPRQKTSGEKGDAKETNAGITLPEWSLESDCLSCHSLEADSAEDTETLYGFHTSAGSEQTCSTCHNEEEKLLKVHESNTEKNSPSKKLTKTQVSSEQCLNCHQSDKIASSTADTAILTDVNGMVVNPHQLPQGSDHEAINCSDCHKMHSEKNALPETAMELCTSCHHEKVFECGTCH